MRPRLGRSAVLALAASLLTTPAGLGQATSGDGVAGPVCIVLLPVEDATPVAAASPAPTALDAAAAPEAAASPDVDAASQDAAAGTMLTDAVRAGVARIEVVDGRECLEGGPPREREGDGRRAERGTPYPRFVARAVQAAIELAALAEATRARDGLDEVARAARRLQSWARSQRRWLERHAPQRCYAGVHGRWLRAITKVENGAADLRAGVRRLDAKRAGRGGRRIATGAARVATVDLEATARRCIEAA